MDTGFGFVTIRDSTYTHDIVIHADGSVTKRNKKRSKGLKEEYGHTPLSEYELDILADEHPAIVYVGTGQYGSLPVTKKAADILARYSPVIATTPDVIRALAGEDRRFVAILHITC